MAVSKTLSSLLKTPHLLGSLGVTIGKNIFHTTIVLLGVYVATLTIARGSLNSSSQAAGPRLFTHSSLTLGACSSMRTVGCSSSPVVAKAAALYGWMPSWVAVKGCR
jgi:hypothetical protein